LATNVNIVTEDWMVSSMFYQST